MEDFFMSNYEDLTNKRFGRLTVLETTRKGSHYFCKCKCDCGNIKIVRKDQLQKVFLCAILKSRKGGTVQ